MSIFLSVRDPEEALSAVPIAVATELKAPLFKTFQLGGDFPVSSQVVRKLREVLAVKDPTIASVVDVVCSDPVLATRLVSLVNVPAYSRGRPVLSVSNAINQLGFTRIVDVVGDFAAQKDFESVFTGRGSCASLMTRVIASCILARRFVAILSPSKRPSEETLIATLLSQLPELLLCFSKPNIYAACFLDSLRTGGDLDKSFKKIFRQTLYEFASEVASALSLPKEYGRMVNHLSATPWNKRSWGVEDKEDTKSIVTSAYLANRITAERFRYGSPVEFGAHIRELVIKAGMDVDDAQEVLHELDDTLLADLEILGLPKLRRPSFKIELKPASQKAQEEEQGSLSCWPQGCSFTAMLNPFLVELKVALKTGVGVGEVGRVYHAVHCTLSALIEALGFDRAALIAYDGETSALKLMTYYGFPCPAADAYVRRLSTRSGNFHPDLVAFEEQRAVFTGDPLFGDDWPFACFPIVVDGESKGVFYADRVGQNNSDGLSLEEQLAVTALAEEWQQVAKEFR